MIKKWSKMDFVSSSFRFTTPLPERGDLDLISRPNSKMLDMGCGYGRTLRYLRENGFKNLTGIDISKDLVLAAREQCPEARYFVGDFEKVKLDEKFDTIFLMAVIEYILTDKCQKIFFKKISDSLNKDGGIFLETFTFDLRSNWKSYLSGFLKTGHWGILFNKLGIKCHHQSARRLSKILSDNFKIIKSQKRKFSTWSGNVCNGHVFILKKEVVEKFFS